MAQEVDMGGCRGFIKVGRYSKLSRRFIWLIMEGCTPGIIVGENYKNMRDMMVAQYVI